MSKTAWYIGCRTEDVGDSAILIGDPARIGRIAKHLEEANILEEKRGLRTVTGRRGKRRITATAFGMGAPIATIVLHELFELGVRTFLRIGTAQVMPPAVLGDFVLAEGALRSEGTSTTYVPLNYPAVADFALGAALRARLERASRQWHAGVFGTYDGFYSQMFALSEGERRMIDGLRQDIQRYRIIATDMETSALLTVGRILGARVSSLCMGTVDGLTQQVLSQDDQAVREAEMFEIALDALASLPPIKGERPAP
jgi:uridine phosphorylase